MKTTSAWPDLHVLEEFIKEELEEVQTDLEPTVNFGGNVVHSEMKMPQRVHLDRQLQGERG